MAEEQMGGHGAVLADEMERAASGTGDAAVLVEGVSDQRAVEALAKRQGRTLEAEGVAVIPIAGATNVGRFLKLLGPQGRDVQLAGLCDEGEVGAFAEALHHAGMGTDLDRDGLEQLGFFVCETDLEEELIRAVGPDRVLSLMDAHGHMRRFRRFQNQPAHRRKSIEAQLWRWLGNFKIQYAPLLVEALDPNRVPRPLEGVLARV